jgi:formate dehydrogenase maturation protein FdhE
LSYREDAADALVSGRRYLSCARCSGAWPYASNSCACCGETGGAQRTVFTERRDKPAIGRADNSAMFPHVRIEACDRCSRYLIDVDMGVDPRAVPEVDELAALPLDLFATERGLEKITPNLMGF